MRRRRRRRKKTKPCMKAGFFAWRGTPVPASLFMTHGRNLFLPGGTEQINFLPFLLLSKLNKLEGEQGPKEVKNNGRMADCSRLEKLEDALGQAFPTWCPPYTLDYDSAHTGLGLIGIVAQKIWRAPGWETMVPRRLWDSYDQAPNCESGASLTCFQLLYSCSV